MDCKNCKYVFTQPSAPILFKLLFNTTLFTISTYTQIMFTNLALLIVVINLGGTNCYTSTTKHQEKQITSEMNDVTKVTDESIILTAKSMWNINCILIFLIINFFKNT